MNRLINTKYNLFQTSTLLFFKMQHRFKLLCKHIDIKWLVYLISIKKINFFSSNFWCLPKQIELSFSIFSWALRGGLFEMQEIVHSFFLLIFFFLFAHANYLCLLKFSSWSAMQTKSQVKFDFLSFIFVIFWRK